MSLDVGFSTGALHYTNLDLALDVSHTLSRPLVELSALHEDELPAVEACLDEDRRTGPLRAFDRVSVHAPIKGRALPESELVARLVATGGDVVMHPDVIESLAAWRPLGASLLVENNDGRKSMGATVSDLEAVFAELPDARMCLDVSHALHAGGLDRAVELATLFATRIAELHVGCACGEPLGSEFSADLVAATAAVCEILARPVPVVLERKTDPNDTPALAAQCSAVAAI